MTTSVTDGYRRGGLVPQSIATRRVQNGVIPMQTMVLSPQVQSADAPTASATLSSRHKLAGVLAGAGALLLPVTMSLPWYRAADGGQTFSAWDGYRFVAAEMVLLAVAGAWLALRLLAGTPVRETALRVIIGVAF